VKSPAARKVAVAVENPTAVERDGEEPGRPDPAGVSPAPAGSLPGIAREGYERSISGTTDRPDATQSK
jgi:hypothetical protein